MRKLLHWSWILVVLAMLYSGITIYMRGQANRELEKEALQKRAAADRETVEMMGGGELKVLTLYASPTSIAKGHKGLLCYGVASAKTVSFDPPVDGAGPAISRCLEIQPEHTTTYTMKATAADGRTDTKAVEVAVR